MGAGLQRALAATALTRLNPDQRKVHETLTHDWMNLDELADKANIRCSSPRETAARHANRLVKLYLAEKSGSRAKPVWRRKQYQG